MRVLLVEHDPTISRFLVKGLREGQHLVDLVEDGPAAIACGEARLLARVVDNLLANAAPYNRDGGEVVVRGYVALRAFPAARRVPVAPHGRRRYRTSIAANGTRPRVWRPACSGRATGWNRYPG